MKDDQNGVLSGIDLSVAAGLYDTLEMEFLRPDGTNEVVTADLFTDGTDSVIKYDNTDAAFIDQDGVWKRRGIISDSVSGAKFTGSWIEFSVEA